MSHHDSSHLHVQGRSVFVDDRPSLPGELFVVPILSRVPAGRLRKLDCRKALAAPGVVAVLTAEDFRHNRWGPVFQDQPLLAGPEILFHGEPVALLLACSRDEARTGASLVELEVTREKPLLSIEAARKAGAFHGAERRILRGDPDAAMSHAPHRLRQTLRIQGAEHFYLENQAALAIPVEDGQLEIYCSTQHPTEVQHVVAHALGLEQSRVSCIVHRMGGAFGGKESQAAPFAAYAALAATKFGRPARCVLTKDEDMVITGKRNPFEIEAELGFDGEGRILALDACMHSDGGAYADLSTAIMERAMLHLDNAYFIPNFRVRGRVCRTNMHPHTAFRGFGAPKGVATIELLIERIAHALGLDPLEVRRRNLYSAGAARSVTPYGQELGNILLPDLVDTLARDAGYEKRRAGILRGNEQVRAEGFGRLRGVSLLPVKFGISFTTRHLNQASALVHIQRDGSIQLSTGATEMGQGVNARIRALVARELGLAGERVRMMPTSTDRNANSSPTAASSGTDLNGAAALIATRKLKRRLSGLALHALKLPPSRRARASSGLGSEPEFEFGDCVFPGDDPNPGTSSPGDDACYFGVHFREEQVWHEENPGLRISFPELVQEAYHNRLSLSEFAHYKFPALGFNKLTGQGRAFLYFTQGAALSEVSVDVETGAPRVEAVDILMDLGRPICEELDIGQIQGGFVQGMGWVTMEKLVYGKDGELLTHAPSTYKIPAAPDTPGCFRVRLFPNDGNGVNVKGTKAVGEPPLLLALSVWTAIQNALLRPSGDYPALGIPATRECILRALRPAEFRRWEGPA